MVSRKFIFVLGASIAFVYFGIILIILSPITSSKRMEYDLVNNNFPVRRAPQVGWCKQLHWRVPPAPSAVALVSFPGSGNTWLRYLLQQVTGIVTGSIYMDYGLRVHGFPAENVSDGSVLVVKTHESPPLEPDRFKAAILLIRNPRDAILCKGVVASIVRTRGIQSMSSRVAPHLWLQMSWAAVATYQQADFNRIHKGHIGTAPKSAFKKKSPDCQNTDWSSFVKNQLVIWETLHNMWLTKFRGPIHVVFYEVLVQDTRNTLQSILNFLNTTVTEDDMKCTLANREGIYRRKKKHSNFDPFTKEMYRELNKIRNKVLQRVVAYQKGSNYTEHIQR